MTAIIGIFVFLAGMAAGGAVVAYHRRAMQRVACTMRKEIRRLETCVWEDKLDKAFEDGYFKGRRDPIHDVEKLAETLSSRKTDIRMIRGVSNGEEAVNK